MEMEEREKAVEEQSAETKGSKTLEVFYVLRWVCLIPVSFFMALIANKTIPFGLLYYIDHSHTISASCFLYFTFGFAFTIAGAIIAPSQKRITAYTLCITFLFLPTIMRFVLPDIMRLVLFDISFCSKYAVLIFAGSFFAAVAVSIIESFRKKYFCKT